MSDLNATTRAAPLGDAHYQALLDAAMEAIILIDEQHRIVVFNPAAEALFGYKRDAVLNQDLNLLIPEQHQSTHRQYVENYSKHGASKREPGEYLTVRGRRATGETFPAKASINNLSVNDHTYLAVFLHDLTAQQIAYDRIEASEKRFSALLSNLPGVVYRCEIDSPWRVDFISDGIRELTGHCAEDFLIPNGVKYADFIHADDIALVEDLVAEGIKKHSHFEIQYRVIDRDNTERWVQEKGICQYDDAGNPAYLDGFIHDITQQKNTEQALEFAKQDLELRVQQRTLEVHTSHQMLDAVFDNSHVLIAILDNDMNFIRVNRAYANTDHQEPDYYIGKNHFSLYPNPENETLFRNAVVDGKIINRSAKAFEYAHNPQRGLTHWDWTLTPIRDKHGNVIQLVLALLDVSKRINALEALGEKELQLRTINENLEHRVQVRTTELASAHKFTEAIVDIVGALVIVLDQHGTIVRFNSACETASGYKASEALGRRVWDFLIPAQEQNDVRNVFSKLTAGDFPNSYQNHWLTKTGQLRLIDWSNSCLVDPQGRITNVIATGIDITEKIDTQRQLLEKQTHLRAIADNAQQSYYLTQINPARSIYVSPMSENILGIPLDRLRNDNQIWMDIIHPDDRERIQQIHLKWIKQCDENFDAEYRIMHPTKGVRWIRASGSWIKNDPTMNNCYGGIIEDITLRKLTEIALRESEEQFRILTENIRDVFWLASPASDKIWYISAAFEKVWGRSMTDILDNPKALLDTIHPDDLTQLLQDHAQQKDGNYQAHYKREFRILRPDGEVRWIVTRYSPIRDNNGEVHRLAGLVEDITERKEIEHQRLIHERNQRDALVREVHHRIKNNLQGIVGLLRQSTDHQPGLRKSVDAAVSQVSTMALVHGLQSNNRDEQIVLCDLCNAISQSIVSITGTTLKPVVTRRTQIPISLRQKEAVPIALILNELIFNAIKHQPENIERTVTINIDKDAGDMVITIRNQGKSLPVGFDIIANKQLGVGLTLARTLLPNGAQLDLRQKGEIVTTTLRLNKTLVEMPEELLELDSH